MSDFLGRVGRITEWVVVSNLENRAVNAACDKAQGWWHDRKHKKRDSHAVASASSVPPPLPPSHGQAKYHASSPQYPPQQSPYVSSPPQPLPPSMNGGQLLITVNQVDGLNQWGPLIVILECNYQRYPISFNQFQQQFTFPINQFDYDQLSIWIQSEYQQQTIAHGEIPVRILLNNNSNWSSQQQQQRWIPLRDQYNGPAGQLLVNAEYITNYNPAQQMSGPPPPYGYYS